MDEPSAARVAPDTGDAALSGATFCVEVRGMAGEQAALRRVATLVARGASQDEVFMSVAEEAGRLLGVAVTWLFRFDPDQTVTLVGGWGRLSAAEYFGLRLPLAEVNVASGVARTGKFVRLAPRLQATHPLAVNARLINLKEVAGSPINVAGRVWGTVSAGAVEGDPFPSDVEQRLTEFAELVAAAIANAAAHVELAGLAYEQSALRRIATLVAEEAPAEDLFAQVAEEVAKLLGPQVESAVFRYEPDDTVTCLAMWGAQAEGGITVGARIPFGGDNATTRVYRERRPVRFDDYTTANGIIADRAQRHGFRAAIGCPILVQSRLWGTVFIGHGAPEPFPPGTEQRLMRFTELLATAISNTEARGELTRLADEQAALRRVATQVAEGTPPSELFAKVAEEVAKLLGPEVESAIFRYEPDDTVTCVGVWGEHESAGIVVGGSIPVGGNNATARVYREGRPVRFDDYSTSDGEIAVRAKRLGIRSVIGCPILVQGSVWGTMIIHVAAGPFARDTEQHLMQFTELVATAIANAQAQSELQRLLDEQAVLRRLAMLVAQGARPSEVFDAVVVELHEQLAAAEVGLMRVDSPNELTILAYHGHAPGIVWAGMRVKVDGDSASAQVLRTGRASRNIVRPSSAGDIAELARRGNVAVSAGAPVVVDGKVWGILTASWRTDSAPPPADVEQRLVEFAELVDTTIANADSRTQLTASRARVLSAADEARRRVVRDLHDGAQQRLVHTIITLKLAQRALDRDPGRARSLLSEALDHAEQGNADLRELAHGILPSVLARGGLRAGVDSVVARLDLPVEVDVTSTRLPPEIEASGYFIIAEALTNVVKHAGATKTSVRAAISDSTVHIEVCDDGVGGADSEGHGLTGLSDRVAALGGSLHIESPHGGGTLLIAQLPLLV